MICSLIFHQIAGSYSYETVLIQKSVRCFLKNHNIANFLNPRYYSLNQVPLKIHVRLSKIFAFFTFFFHSFMLITVLCLLQFYVYYSWR